MLVFFAQQFSENQAFCADFGEAMRMPAVQGF
jgi:hypothetical protein